MRDPQAMRADEYDFVVVGGGVAGCVLAARLSEDPDASVLLLEAGAETGPEASAYASGTFSLWGPGTSWGLASVPQQELDDRTVDQPAGRLIGGSAAINIGYWSRGVPADYDAWEAAGATGWGWATASAAYRRIESSSRPEQGTRGKHGPMKLEDLRPASAMTEVLRAACVAVGLGETVDHNGERPLGFDRWESIFPGGRRHTSADAYLTGAVRTRSNLHVVARAEVVRLVVEGGRAIGVSFLTDHGPASAQVVREVVLCAGTVGSPRVLMLSGLGPAEHLRSVGIDVVADLPGVGDGLFDHLGVPVGALAVGAGIAPVISDPQGPGQLREWRRTGRGPLSLLPFTCMALARSRPDLSEPDVELLFSVNPPPGLSTDPEASGYTVYAAALQPLSRGSVRLASADPSVPPLVDPRYLTGGQDLADLVAVVRTALAVTAADELSGYRAVLPSDASEEDIVSLIRATAFSLYHPCGTLRMGSADDGAPVDPQLRLRGVEGLRVVDASVIPVPVRGHTMAPTLYVAERGSELLAQG